MLTLVFPAVSLPFDHPRRMLICPFCQSISDHFNPKASSGLMPVAATHRVNSAQMAAQEKFLEAIKLTASVA